MTTDNPEEVVNTCSGTPWNTTLFALEGLVLVGAEDALTPPEASKEIVAGLVQGSRYVEISGAGHLSPLEKPAEFNEELHLFLHEVAP